ncbi:hypothetical protein Tco_0932548 [Tanacetum coccineum]
MFQGRLYLITKVIIKLNDFQSTLTTFSTQSASISESLKEEPKFNQRLLKVVLEFNQRLLKAAEGYIHNSSRLIEIANSLKAINFPSFHQRITAIVKQYRITIQVTSFSPRDEWTKCFKLIKGMSSSTPPSGVPSISNNYST